MPDHANPEHHLLKTGRDVIGKLRKPAGGDPDKLAVELKSMVAEGDALSPSGGRIKPATGGIARPSRSSRSVPILARTTEREPAFLTTA
jgi:hypothetical protein